MSRHAGRGTSGDCLQLERRVAASRTRGSVRMKFSNLRLRAYQIGLAVLLVIFWHVATSPTLLPPIYFENPDQAAFFFGRPLGVFQRIVDWFWTGEIFSHLWVTLFETMVAFAIGTIGGLVIGMWLALSPNAAAVLDPYITAMNSMPRVILAPIFSVWFGLGVWSKVALGVTLVFFIVFFNVYQGVREVSPNVLASARMLGATQRQLLRHVYLPSAMSWVFSSLHTSVGLAFVAAVVGEYLGLGERRRLSDPAGRRQLRHQHRVRRHHRPHHLRAGAGRPGEPRGEAADEVAAALRRDREAVGQAGPSGSPSMAGTAPARFGGSLAQKVTIPTLPSCLAAKLVLHWCSNACRAACGVGSAPAARSWSPPVSFRTSPLPNMKKRVVAPSICVVLALMAAACGGGDSDSPARRRRPTPRAAGATGPVPGAAAGWVANSVAQVKSDATGSHEAIPAGVTTTGPAVGQRTPPAGTVALGGYGELYIGAGPCGHEHPGTAAQLRNLRAAQSPASGRACSTASGSTALSYTVNYGGNRRGGRSCAAKPTASRSSRHTARCSGSGRESGLTGFAQSQRARVNDIEAVFTTVQARLIADAGPVRRPLARSDGGQHGRRLGEPGIALRHRPCRSPVNILAGTPWASASCDWWRTTGAR